MRPVVCLLLGTALSCPRAAAQDGGGATLAASNDAPSASTGGEGNDPGIDGEELVTVIGTSRAQELQRSANAVTVVDLERAKKESADLGEVLARVQGVNVQRTGGLGSPGRLNLGGFDEGQVRIFLDGVPIDLAGFTFGLQNLPIHFAERIDIYKGVVPVRLGADALGGALEVITDHETQGSGVSLSYQGGSFQTHRFAASARHHSQASGLFLKAEGFVDASENNYPIDVQVAGADGSLSPARAYRFHDGYRAGGGNIEVGLVDRPWAKRLLLRGFYTDYTKDFQHNANMSTPYGEAQFGGPSMGGNLRYESYLGGGVRADLVTGYSYDRADWQDASKCIYNWFGRCVFERQAGGEVGRSPSDRSLWAHTTYARWTLSWLLHPSHSVRLAIAPTHFVRRGEERALGDTVLDRLGGHRKLFTWVGGLEYDSRFFDERLQNVAFAKVYSLDAKANQPIAGEFELNLETDGLYVGGGNGLRFEALPGLVAKASYEYATRIPEPTEYFGNGGSISENLELKPERSHNGNLSLLVEDADFGIGTFNGNLTGFVRRAQNLVVLLGQDGLFQYRNVGEVRILGVEGAVRWLSPGRYLELAGNVTYQDARNVSTEGAFANFRGDRLTNRPYLFGNGSVRLQYEGAMHGKDALSLTYYGRYVHEFFKNWESVGTAQSKASVDAQLVHWLVLAYATGGGIADELSFSFEIQNITDEKTFDFFGVQRPGRAFWVKTTASF